MSFVTEDPADTPTVERKVHRFNEPPREYAQQYGMPWDINELNRRTLDLRDYVISITPGGTPDYYTQAESDARFAAAVHTHTFASLTGKPTTLAGYGITDGQPLDGDLTAIAALAGTAGLLRKTAANTWSLDTQAYQPAGSYITVSGNVTQANLATLTGGGATTLHTHSQYEVAANRNVANGYAGLDSGGLIALAQLPAIAITDTFVVADQAAMLALTAQAGDVAVRTDLSKSFILKASPASTLANWQELLSPTTMAWTSITGKPTTLGGYGITDAFTMSASDARYLRADTASTGVGKVTLDGGAGALALKPGSSDHVYMELYARTAAPSTRSGYIGYGGTATTGLSLRNDIGSITVDTTTTAGASIFLSAGSTGGIVLNRPLTGTSATLSGALSGTSATFTGAVRVSSAVPQFELLDTDIGGVGGVWSQNGWTSQLRSQGALELRFDADQNTTTEQLQVFHGTAATRPSFTVASAVAAAGASPEPRVGIGVAAGTIPAAPVHVAVARADGVAVQVDGAVMPDATGTRDLGSTSVRWAGIWGTTLNVSGAATLGSTLSVVGNVSAPDGTVNVASHLAPEASGTRDLGTAALRWDEAFTRYLNVAPPDQTLPAVTIAGMLDLTAGNGIRYPDDTIQPTACSARTANGAFIWGDMWEDTVVQGGGIGGSGLSRTIDAGTWYGNGVRIYTQTEAHTYTASRDTYVDATPLGAYVYTEVANGAAAPSVAAGNVRLYKVVTNATQVSGITFFPTKRAEFKEHIQLAWNDLSFGNADRIHLGQRFAVNVWKYGAGPSPSPITINWPMSPFNVAWAGITPPTGTATTDRWAFGIGAGVDGLIGAPFQVMGTGDKGDGHAWTQRMVVGGLLPGTASSGVDNVYDAPLTIYGGNQASFMHLPAKMIFRPQALNDTFDPWQFSLGFEYDSKQFQAKFNGTVGLMLEKQSGTGNWAMEWGANEDVVTVIDMHASTDPAHADYASRIMRTAGAAGDLVLDNLGTGDLVLKTGGVEVLRGTSTGATRLRARYIDSPSFLDITSPAGAGHIFYVGGAEWMRVSDTNGVKGVRTQGYFAGMVANFIAGGANTTDLQTCIVTSGGTVTLPSTANRSGSWLFVKNSNPVGGATLQAQGSDLILNTGTAASSMTLAASQGVTLACVSNVWNVCGRS